MKQSDELPKPIQPKKKPERVRLGEIAYFVPMENAIIENSIIETLKNQSQVI